MSDIHADTNADDGTDETRGQDRVGTAPGDDRTSGGVPRWVSNAVVLAVLWLFVRGVALTPTRLLEEGVIGLGIGTVIALGFRRLYGGSSPFERSLRTVPFAGLYLLTFIKELVVANLAVARLVLSPSMPIEPAVIEVPLRVRTDAAITTIANSITLTPGTLTMDYDRETNALYVHAIDGSDEAAVLDPIRRWEGYALTVFDEELSPDDPVPTPPGRGPAADGGETDG
ncbi:MAG: Na+/H+ antiporter subunit E [Halolamina sp.]